MKKIAIATILATAAIAANAGPTSLSLGYSDINVDVGRGLSASPGVATLAISNEVHKNLDIEATAGVGVRDGDIGRDRSGNAVGIRVKSMYGASLKPKMEIAENVTAFGRVGKVRINLEGYIGSSAIAGSDSSTIYGAGLEFAFSKTNSLAVEYNKFSGLDTESTSVAFKHKF